MSKKCSRCDKTVYPIEELKCLDKIWHKQCFKCQVCQMTLNMRNYKGFNKEPYCGAHIPKAKATTVAETPEYKRIAENTKIQSNVKYHAEFEKAKGRFTQVADDPETLRIKENSKNISNVAYHGELEKKALMEKQRNIGENGEEVLEPPPPAPIQHYPEVTQQSQRQPGDGNINTSYPTRQSSTVIYTSDRGPVSSPPNRRIGSIQDLDPVNDFYGSLSGEFDGKLPPNHPSAYYNRTQQPPQQQQQQSAYPQKVQHGYHQQSKTNDYGQQMKQQYQQQPPQQQQPNVNYVSNNRDASYDYNAVSSNGYQKDYTQPQQHYGNEYHRAQPDYQPPHQNRSSGRVFRAMYDYKAQDADEVSFRDGDLIINCTPIDEGWLQGVVERTGKSGMLPANYVQPAI